MASIQDRLKKAKKGWKSSKKKAKEQQGFAEFDDGRYVMKLVNAALGESQSSDRIHIIYEWQFLEGNYSGQKKRDFDGVLGSNVTEDTLMWTHRKIARLGFEPPDDPTDIGEVLDEMTAAGIIAQIRLKSKGDFQNLYVDKVLTEYEPGDSDSDDEDVDDADTEDDDDEIEDDDSDDDDDDDDDEDDDDDDDIPEEPEEKPVKKGKGKGKGKRKG